MTDVPMTGIRNISELGMPPGLGGENFMTPLVDSYWRVVGANIHVEISRERGPVFFPGGAAPMWGFTARYRDGSEVRRSNGEQFSQCCDSRAEAMALLRELGEQVAAGRVRSRGERSP